MLRRINTFIDFKTFALFIFLLLIFFYRIFFGEIYTTTNMYYHFPPWNHEYTNEGTRGTLLSDPIDHLITNAYFVKENLLNGDFSLWNPRYSLGEPFEFSFLSILFNPINWIYLLIPMNIAPTAIIFIKLLICLVGMYKFLRENDISVYSSRIGAIIFTFSLPMIVWINWPHTTVSIFAPWLFYSLTKVMQGTRYHVPVSAYIIGIMMYAHMPAYLGYYLLLGSLYFLYKLFIEYLEHKSILVSIKKAFLLLLPVILGVIFSISYIVSFLRYILESGYYEQRQNIFNVFFSLDYLTSFYAPRFLNDIGNKTYSFNEYAVYFSIIGFALFIMSIFIAIRLRKRVLWFWIITAFCTLAIVYGAPLYHIASKIPVIGSSIALRLIGPLMFMSAVIVAFTVDYIIKTKNRSYLVKCTVLTICILAGVFLIGIINLDGFKLTKSLILSSIFLFSFIVLIVLFLRRALSIKIFISTLSLLILTDIFMAGMHFNPSVSYEKSILAPKTDTTTFLQDKLDNNRFLATGQWTLFANSSVYYGINDMRGHSYIMRNSRIQNYYKSIDSQSFKSPTHPSFYKIENNYLVNAASVKYIVVEDILIQNNSLSMNSNQTPIGEITKNTIVEQEFLSTRDYLGKINILFATYSKKIEKGNIFFNLLNDKKEVIREVKVPLKNVVDNQYVSFEFDPIHGSENKKYFVQITSDTLEDQSPTIWASDVGEFLNGILTINDEIIPKEIIFNTGYKMILDYDNIGDFDNISIYYNKDALPRAYLVSCPKFINEPSEILDKMRDGRIYDIAYVEEMINEIDSECKGNDKYTSVDEFQDNNSKISIKVNNESDKFLVLTDNYYNGWKAYINGEETKIYRTNYLFKGIFVPAGENEILFEYKPPFFKTTLIVSFISLLLLFFAFITLRRNNEN